MTKNLSLIVVLWLVVWQPVHAVLEIEITQGVESAVPIAVVPFGWSAEAPAPIDIAQIVGADLQRSGLFAPLARADLLATPTRVEDVNFAGWRMLGVDHLVIGNLRTRGALGYDVEFQLFDIYQGKPLMAYTFPAAPSELRRAAHHVADLIYEKLTGQRGAFNTRIAYVSVQRDVGGDVHQLQVADADAYGEQIILRSKHPLLSPSWSPDGTRLAYVSFENGNSEVFIQELASGQRSKIAGYRGINSAPAWSPRGDRLAMTLSRDGNPEIYVMDLASRSLQRITDNAAIDTEPAWSPDGKNIVFTSDRGGQPQLYMVSSSGGRPVRVTFEGDYNARATFAPDGRNIAFVHRQGGGFRIAVMDLQSGLLRVVSNGRLDESPSFSPNGRMILYASSDGGRGVLAAVSADGRFRQRLARQGSGDVREPAWSPFEKR